MSSRAAIAIDYAKFFQLFTSCCLLQKDRLAPRALQKHLTISPIPLPSFAAPQTHWTKVLFTVVGTGCKIILDYVIRRLYAFSAGLKNRLKGLTFAETPLSAISRFNWSPESPEAGRC